MFGNQWHKKEKPLPTMIGMGGGATSLQQNAGGVAVSFYGDRGITAGGNGPSNVIQYYDITSTGNATDFGDLLEARYDLSPSSDGSRGIFSGGANPSVTDTISYVMLLLPTGIAPANISLLFSIIDTEVVPEPKSILIVPKSFSSLINVAKLEAKGEATKRSTFKFIFDKDSLIDLR